MKGVPILMSALSYSSFKKSGKSGMRPRRLLTRQAVLLSGVVLTAASCSVIFDLDQVQCEVHEDCAGFDEDDDVACIEGICTIPGTGGVGNTSNTTSPSTTS